ncbi:MAG: MopE-related protein, partial [Myxococcota bacterium]
MALAAAWMGLIEAGWAQQVTNTTTGIGYTTLTTAVNGASSGDVLVVDPGTVVDTGTIFVSKDLTIEGAGKGVSILTLSVSAPLTVLQPTAGVSLTLRDLTVQGYGERQSPVNALDGGNTFVAERVAFEGTADFDFALVTLVEPAAASFDGVDFRGTADFDAGALSSAGLGVAGSSVLYAPVDVVDSTFTDLRVSDLASAIVVQFVDLTCTRCTFVRAGVPNANPDLTEISVEGQYSTVGITESRFCDSGAVALYPADGSVTNNLFVRSAGPLLQGVVALSNNTFAAPISPIAAQYSGAVDVRNNLLYATETGSAGVTIDATASAVVEYNWFEAMGVPLIGGGTLSATNRVDGGDPLLVGWPVPADVDCASLALYPTPVASPLLDVGDPALIDPDGTSSDIGAYGGPGAPAVPYHGDADSDGAPFFHDCNEQNAHVWPGAPEVCDGLDDDCDGLADDDDPDVDLSTSTSWVPDCDLDGQGGVGGLPIDGCSPPPFDPCPDGGGWSTGSADCDDDDPVTYDGAPELCLDGDQSCDGDPLADAIDAVELWVDLDGDGFGAGSPSVGCPAVGLVAVGGDCDDSIGSIHPGLPDACGDGVDTDCDGGDGDLT